MVSIDTDARWKKQVRWILKFKAAAELFEQQDFFLFSGVVTAVSAVCVQHRSYVDDGQVNEPVCAYVGDVQGCNQLGKRM